jgi:alanine racemase
MNDVAITSSSIDKSKAIQTAAKALGKKALVHLKIDTGMERIGVHWYNAQKFIEETLQLPDIQVAGIFSHLAKAESDSHFTQEQITRFESIVNYMDRQSILPPYVHLANSAAIINNPESHFTMVRPGIMLYGYNPNGYNPAVKFNGKKLLPVMTLKTKVSYFKVVPADTGISYNHLYKTTTQTRVVTLPVGYGDGYSRLLSNQGEVIIRGKKYPVVGAVCMDQLMVNIGYDGTAYNGDDVLLFGQMDGYSIPLESLCEKIGTITYEVLTNISPRVPRIYIQ